MRRVITTVLAAGLVVGVGMPGTAQEDDAADGFQRVEVAEAGVAVAVPAGWAADVEMREREDWGLYDEGLAQEPVAYWNVIYASDGGGAWCDLVWYPAHPLSLTEHADRYVALMTPTHADVERSIEVAPVSLAAGEAYRFVVFNEPTDDYTTTYLLGAADTRYLLQCVDDERHPDDWLPLARSLEVLGAISAARHQDP